MEYRDFLIIELVSEMDLLGRLPASLPWQQHHAYNSICTMKVYFLKLDGENICMYEKVLLSLPITIESPEICTVLCWLDRTVYFRLQIHIKMHSLPYISQLKTTNQHRFGIWLVMIST
jgi:hypothetical protein